MRICCADPKSVCDAMGRPILHNVQTVCGFRLKQLRLPCFLNYNPNHAWDLGHHVRKGFLDGQEHPRQDKGTLLLMAYRNYVGYPKPPEVKGRES